MYLNNFNIIYDYLISIILCYKHIKYIYFIYIKILILIIIFIISMKKLIYFKSK